VLLVLRVFEIYSFQSFLVLKFQVK